MRRTYWLLFLVLLCFVMSACSKRGSESNISESSTESPSTVSSSVIESSSASVSSEIPPADYQTYYDKYVEPLRLSRILTLDWNNLNDVFEQVPETQTIGYLVQGLLTPTDEWASLAVYFFEKPEHPTGGGVIYISQEIAETTIMQYFDIDVAKLRKNSFYNVDKQAYKYLGAKDDGPEVDILSIEQDGDYIILHCEYRIDYTTTAKNDLTIKQSNDYFQYISNRNISIPPQSPSESSSIQSAPTTIKIKLTESEIFAKWETQITNGTDITNFCKYLDNLSPCDFHGRLMGGYYIVGQISRNNQIEEYGITINNNNGEMPGYVMAFKLSPPEYDIAPYSENYKWYFINSNIWEIISSYADLPFEYKDGEFID